MTRLDGLRLVESVSSVSATPQRPQRHSQHLPAPPDPPEDAQIWRPCLVAVRFGPRATRTPKLSFILGTLRGCFLKRK